MKLLIIIQSLVLLLFANSLQNNRAQTIILVDKPKSELYVINKTFNDTIFTCPVGLGKNYGNKVKSGDNRTPEGTFRIVSIEKASHWTHDFHDGHGPRNGAYGDWFIRLSVPGSKASASTEPASPNPLEPAAPKAVSVCVTKTSIN